jgi:hypothetical protein
MAIGEPGLLLDPAVLPAEEELKVTPEFATTQHHQTVEQHAQGLLLKVSHATHSLVLLVITYYKKAPNL